MRTLVFSLSAFMYLTASSASAGSPELVTDEQRTLYTLGLVISQSLGTFNLTEAELEFVKAGLSDGVLNRRSKVDAQAYIPKVQKLQRARAAQMADKERKAGEAFLATAAAEKGAVRTSSGMVIQALKEGTGPVPKETDSVTVHYQGTLIDGTVFESSVQRGEPVTLSLSEVIPCWTEGIQHMKVGGKSRLVCPAALAYGDRGVPPTIKPGATVVFEVELLNIVTK
jgi:FKBP-type peptidyl-prolyl cis-trans isomerase FkpA/FKBP-type peptidyl-prolyl cis-trans isomerase FklB